MSKRVLIWCVWLLLVGLPLNAQEFAPQNISFTALKQFSLSTTTGRKTVVDKPKKPLSLFVLLSPECPLCKNYTLVLNKLQQQYRESLQVYGIIPGRAYTGKELKQYAADFKIGFPLLIDASKRFADYLNATVTPEVILADSSGLVVYRGAIDDWVQELGKKKLQPQQHYLQQAISQYISGQPVTTKVTVAKGCLINEF